MGWPMSKDKEVIELKARIRQLEEENHYLNFVVQSLPVSIYWKDTKGVYLGCSRYVTDMAGVSSPEVIIGKTDADLPWSRYAQQFKSVDTRIINERVTEEVEEKAVLSDGEEHHFLTTKGPLCDDKDRVIGVLGVSVDITDRVKVQQALMIAKENAEVANKAKEEFLYNMRHDIRTPFSGITGMAQLLLSKEDDEEKLRYINNIYISAEELLDHLNTILEFTQTDKGSIPVVGKKLDLKETLQSCINMFMPGIETKKIRLCFDYDPNLDGCYVTDEFRIKRIVMNLLGNAVKFTDDNGQIYISTHFVKKDVKNKTSIVQISVRDSGIGIPKDKQEIIFEKFERLTSSYKGKYKGTGLGLYSVKTLVHDLEGRVSVFSDLGEGATFTCDIPMRWVEVNSVPAKSLDSKSTKKQLFFSTSPSILVVEDSPVVQLATSNLLDSLHCFVDVADSGEMAVRCCQESVYDLILMDIGLPGVDGFETTRQIRKLPDGKLTPIVALTAHAAHEVGEKCQKAGMNSAISKPLTKEKVIAVLQEFTAQECELGDIQGEIDLAVEAYAEIDADIIDIRGSIEKCSNIEEVKKYLFLLKDAIAVSLKLIHQSLEENELAQLAKEVHKVKGGLSLVSLPALQCAIGELSESAKDMRDSKVIGDLLNNFEDEVVRFIKELDKV